MIRERTARSIAWHRSTLSVESATCPWSHPPRPLPAGGDADASSGSTASLEASSGWTTTVEQRPCPSELALDRIFSINRIRTRGF